MNWPKKTRGYSLLDQIWAMRPLNSLRMKCLTVSLWKGSARQNLIGISAGLAMEGKIVYANTIATFLSRRCFEQIVLDMALHHVNVRLIANGGGLVYAPLRPHPSGH